MPIILDDMQTMATTPVNTYSPKFFNKDLTGKGSSSPVGLLSSTFNPAAIKPEVTTTLEHSRMAKRSYTNGQTNVQQIPVNSLTYNAWEHMDTIPAPDKSDLCEIGTVKGRPNCKAYIRMDINAMLIQKTTVTSYQTGVTSTERTFITNYQIFAFAENDPASSEYSYMYSHNRRHSNQYGYMYSSNPVGDINDLVNWLKNTMNINVIFSNLQDYLMNFDLFDSVSKRSCEWQTSIDQTLDVFFENIAQQNPSNPSIQHILEQEVKYIINYNIPLDLYKNIYASIQKHFTPDIAREICKQNLNLLLSDTMQNLAANKGNINTFTVPANITIPPSVNALSPEQRRAVESTEPLILTQSGAGTGKSTLILGRIDYLIACGVNARDITVISFTNAAADHIKEKNPNVNSMTMARMIHEIYTNNFQNHELSSIDTLINSLDIYYPIGTKSRTDFIDAFKRRLTAILKNEANNFTEMNNFIEKHYDEVIDTLNTIEQTSLELEIIIAYQKIETFVEPPTVQSRFLIIDEVQDNSIFEFIYTLKYVEKHQESLFCVGDCSQTLYEFRASNPRALNILEASGTFQTYQLTTNYRSNQEILDFANVALQNIEANQYAQIQLRANSLAKVTEQSFLDKVRLNYRRLGKITEFHEKLPSIFAREIKPYIDSCLAKGEKVAFLAFTRYDINTIAKILEVQYPNQTSVNLVPKKTYNSTILSTFIMKYWNEIKFVPTNNILTTIIREIMSRIQYIVYNPQKNMQNITDMLREWRNKASNNVAVWQYQLANGQMTHDEFLDNIKHNMLQYEITQNAIKQRVISDQNQQQKEAEKMANADFLLSTIHSAKGLEFDNVVVLYRAENGLDEEKKRMYYVAFTRAMHSEYILAYDTMMSPQIQADYMTILNKLHAVAPSPNSPLSVIPKNKRIKIV